MENNLKKEFETLCLLMELSFKINKNMIDLFTKSEKIIFQLIENVDDEEVKMKAIKSVSDIGDEMERLIIELKTMNPEDIDKSKLN